MKDKKLELSENKKRVFLEYDAKKNTSPPYRCTGFE